MRKHLSGVSSVLAHHCGEITKLKWRRRLKACCRAQLDHSKHVTFNALLRSCLQNDSGLPTLEFDTDSTTHHSRKYQLGMQVLAAGCKKSVPCVLRRGCGSTSILVEAGGGGGGREEQEPGPSQLVQRTTTMSEVLPAPFGERSPKTQPSCLPNHTRLKHLMCCPQNWRQPAQHCRKATLLPTCFASSVSLEELCPQTLLGCESGSLELVVVQPTCHCLRMEPQRHSHEKKTSPSRLRTTGS